MTIEWQHTQGLIHYTAAMTQLEQRVTSIMQGEADDLVWFLEHEGVYTLGNSSDPDRDVLSPILPVITTNRGGKATYHNQGQRIVYVALKLSHYNTNVKCFIHSLETMIINSLKVFNIHALQHPTERGVFVPKPNRLDKIAALGLRVRKGVIFHGLSINATVDLRPYEGIIACGLDKKAFQPTSIEQETNFNREMIMPTLDQALKQELKNYLTPANKD